MKFSISKAARGICLIPLVMLSLSSVTMAQTPPAAGAANATAKMQMAGPGDMKQSMMMGMESMQKMTMSGDADKDFAMMMKIHHQGAIDMAQMELSQGKSSEMKATARKIIAAQKKEIAQFDKWLAKQK